MKAPGKNRAALAACATFDRTRIDSDAFRTALADNLHYRLGQAAYTASDRDIYMALAYTVRDFLSDRWGATIDTYFQTRPKFIYYLSAEYLPGPQLYQNLLYTGTLDVAREALESFGLHLEDYLALDPEPGLGNGGLGRLASCFMDSLASLDIPAVGYGIRYDYGIFKQSFRDGWQVESPDEWLYAGNPWEVAQPDHLVVVKFGGHTEHELDAHGRYFVKWIPSDTVLGEPYHTMVPGYGTQTVNLLRLWSARASKEFDFQLFNDGDFMRAVAQKTSSENLSKVLYPNDNTPQGRELRLRQQYFFVACSLNNIIGRFLAFQPGWEDFKGKVVMQLNDTHPTIAIPELMRLLMDEYGFGWNKAWEMTSSVFAYTCHTLMPEALERWPVPLMQQLLPRHMEIIYEINAQFLETVRKRFPGDDARLARLSIIEEGAEKHVRMANLACVGCFSVNGVAALHTKLLQEVTLKDFAELWPEKFNNKTNGISPRRFIKIANPGLSKLLDQHAGTGWEKDLSKLKVLEKKVNNADFRRQWEDIKRTNKIRLAEHIQRKLSLTVDPDSLFDVMVKRLHEYKRQMLKALHMVAIYRRMLLNPDYNPVKRTFIFGAKAAPGYRQAKLIIKLINDISVVVNNDSRVKDRLKIVFLPNFDVSQGELVYPAADLSEQISMAGKEASGTGNMKFTLNGALTVGTLDGANIEIRDAVGAANFFTFGLTTPEVYALKSSGYRPMDRIEADEELREIFAFIESGHFSGGNAEVYRPLLDALYTHDEYLVLADFRAYMNAQEQVEIVFKNREEWTRRSIINVARSGFFSSDRAIRDYCRDIWGIKGLDVTKRKRGKREEREER